MMSLKDVKRLLAFENDGYPVSTLTLNVDGRRFPKREEYMIPFKNLVKEAREWLKRQEIDQKGSQSIDEDLDKMEIYLRDQFQRNHHRSVVMTSCSRKGLWQTFAFPVPLRPNLTIDSSPYTRPLTSLLDQYGRYCAVLVSSERARIFEVYLGEIEEHSEIFEELPGKVHDPSSKEYKSLGEYGLAERKIQRRSRKSGSRIWGAGGDYGLAENKIGRHTEDHVKKHLKRVAEMTFSYFKDNAFDHLILGGQVETLVDFEPMLHSYLQSRIVGRINTDPKAHFPEVFAETQKLIGQVEWEQKDRLIREIADASRQGGLGALGREATFDALVQGAVHTLVIQEEFHVPGARCDSCNYLSPAAGKCPRCGGDLQPAVDLMEEAVEEAISQRAEIYHISGHPMLDVQGGMAAKLRFRLAEGARRPGEAA